MLRSHTQSEGRASIHFYKLSGKQSLMGLIPAFILAQIGVGAANPCPFHARFDSPY